MPRDRAWGEMERDNYSNLSDSEEEGLLKTAEAFLTIGKFITNELPQQYKDGSDLLLKEYGWHLRMDMSFHELIPLAKKDDTSIDKYFCKSLRWSLWRIRRKAIKRFPTRKRAINLAFKAHRRREFELSIPAFLVLSEGVFRELTKGDIFAKKSKEKTSFVEVLKKNTNVIPLIPYTIEAVINGDIIGLSFSNGDNLAYPNVLHRNKIFHGADVDYGSRVNSYKVDILNLNSLLNRFI
ncbi:hypothetical protein [Algoriphagus antarcticus]|nr:hypothetical protein [Algoriphagus antarcticus]